jgi:hypothetical protein
MPCVLCRWHKAAFYCCKLPRAPLSTCRTSGAISPTAHDVIHACRFKSQLNPHPNCNPQATTVSTKAVTHPDSQATGTQHHAELGTAAAWGLLCCCCAAGCVACAPALCIMTESRTNPATASHSLLLRQNAWLRLPSAYACSHHHSSNQGATYCKHKQNGSRAIMIIFCCI